MDYTSNTCCSAVVVCQNLTIPESRGRVFLKLSMAREPRQMARYVPLQASSNYDSYNAEIILLEHITLKKYSGVLSYAEVSISFFSYMNTSGSLKPWK